MIYVGSLAAPMKRAYGDKCLTTNIAKICETMALDPKVSQMDACVLGVKDVAGVNRAKIQAALKTKNPDVCFIYIYGKDKEGELLDVPFKKCLKKITPDTIKQAVDSYLGSMSIAENRPRVTRDAVTLASKEEEKTTVRPVSAASVKGGLLKKAAAPEEKEVKQELEYDEALELSYKTNVFGERTYIDKDGNELSMAQVQAQKDRIAARPPKPEVKPPVTFGEDDDDDDIQVNVKPKTPDVPKTKEVTVTVYVDEVGNEVGPNYPNAKPVQKVKVVPNEEYSTGVAPAQTIKRAETQFEKNILGIHDFHDWDYFKKSMQKDVIMRELLQENASFQGVVQMLNVLDAEIKGVYYDRGLSTEQKFEKIMEIGGRRAQLMAAHNDIVSKKIIDIIDLITISSRRTVEDLLAQHREAIDALSKQDKNLMSESAIDECITKRSKIIVELMACYRSVISLLQAMEVEVREFVVGLDKNLPSDNEFINKMCGAAVHVCIPTNTAEIANKLMSKIMETISNKPGSLSALGNYIRTFIDSTVELLKSDEEIIEYQQNLIRLLKAHRVEDAVVIDGILKNILNVYIGADDVGRTATTLAWSGCLSRRRNTLLIDMSKSSKLKDYGIAPIDLHEFMNMRIDKPLCIVAGCPTDVEELTEIMKELKTRLDYYAYINIVFDSSQVEEAAIVSDEALSVNYITNCTNESIRETAQHYKRINQNNIARKLIMVDPPVSVLEIAKRTGVDPTTTKCITIPNIQRVKTCSVVHDAPYEYAEVRSIFEEAFR